MQNILKEAIKSYIESIEADVVECKSNPKKGFVAKISTNGDFNYDIFIVLPESKLKYIANLWFGEGEFDADDLTKEIANLIVGNAKVVASNKGINFDISTPEFLGEYNNNIDYDDILKYKFKNRCFYIAFKGK